MITLDTSHLQAFEFGVPPGSGLTFTPHMGLVPPSKSMRVQIDFAPLPEEPEGEAVDESATTSSLPGAGGSIQPTAVPPGLKDGKGQ
jgi:hypothetical protein